jgi:hypothetical protein
MTRGLILAVMLVLATTAFGQVQLDSSYWSWNNQSSLSDVVTDSVVWYLWKVDNVGDTLCSHEWIKGEETIAGPGYGCLVNHYGFHCDYDDGVYSRICHKCLRKETWREQWYQHRPITPKTEYEKLDEMIKKEKKP